MAEEGKIVQPAVVPPVEKKNPRGVSQPVDEQPKVEVGRWSDRNKAFWKKQNKLSKESRVNEK